MNPWTDEETEQLVRMVADGKSAREIAVWFGRSRNAVIGRCGRLGLRLAGGNASVKTAKKNQVWTEARWREFSAMWREGRTAAEIGRVYGISASTVKYRAQTRRDICPARGLEWNRMSSRKAIASRTGSVNIDRERRMREHASAEGQEYDATALNITMMDIRSGQCRWPVNAPERGGEFLFCGHEVASGESYCQHHHLRGTVPTGRVRA